MSTALEGVLVVELGGREAVGVCGTLLAQLGATVVVVEPGAARSRDGCRAQFTAGKLSLSYDLRSEADAALLRELVEASDVVITSSDVDPAELQLRERLPAGILCDVTAFGASGPRAGEALGEWQLQALTGIMDTTGPADGPPVAIGVPVIAYMSGTWAAAAVVAALRVKRRQGFGQRIEVAMFDAAFLSLHVFLAGVFSGEAGGPTRLGNRHATTAAWNLFETADGKVLICAGSQSHWLKLCELMGRPDVAGKYETNAVRMRNIDQVDAAIEAWTRTLTTAQCVEKLVAAGVAAGPIAGIDGYPREVNLEFRQMIRKLHDPVSGGDVFVPASPVALRGSPPVPPAAIPERGGDKSRIEDILKRRPSAAAPAVPPQTRERPLAGVRIIEVGQYTTAPFCARHLAHLGADVIKVEKRGGDESRTFGHRVGNRSDIYCMSNPDKRSIELDLQNAGDADVLKSLLRTADVLVENNKPGTLAKFGFTTEALAQINPRLVYCAISGFGAESLYGDRPGFDTVIQATSGFMTAVNPGGTPLKSGISTSDLMGAQMGMVAILAALEYRDRCGQGQFIDLSMQDVSCWVTAPAWNADFLASRRPSLVRCSDGYVLADLDEAALNDALARAGLSLSQLATSSRTDAHDRLSGLGLPTAPVNSVAEVCELSQTKARGLWFTLPVDGRDWPVPGTPMRLEATAAEIRRAAPGLNEDGPAILREIGRA